MTERELAVERIAEYSEENAAGIGRLMPFLDESFPDTPLDRELLQDIVASPFHDQLVARLDGVIVGAATMSLVMGAGGGRKAQLEDFVADPNVRGQGIGNKVWNEMLKWCEEQRATKFEFTSSDNHSVAHPFYLNRGAVIRDTNVFRLMLDPPA